MKTKIPKRSYTMGIRLKADEHDFLKSEAEHMRVRLSDYVRNVLLFRMNLPHSVSKINA